MMPDWSEYLLAIRKELKDAEECATHGNPMAASIHARSIKRYAGMLAWELARQEPKRGAE